jgi:hypothetical protein
MHKPTRLVLTCGIVVAFLGSIVAGVSSIHPGTVDELQGEQCRAVQLDADLRMVARHMRTKDRITDALIAEKLSLLEAAACFEHVDREWLSPRPRVDCQAASDEEYYCRQVLRYVDARGPACAVRFKQEFDDLMLQHNLRFPAEDETARWLESMNH